MRLRSLFAAALFSLGAMASAYATPHIWTDTKTFDQYVGEYDSFSYTHTLSGFIPSVDHVYGFSLNVALYDDRDSLLEDLFVPEIALVDVSGWTGDRIFWGVSGSEFGGWSIEGLTELD